MADGTQQLEHQPFHWREAQVWVESNPRDWPREEPLQPAKGQVWYDEETENLCVWNGQEWVLVPKD